MKLLTDNIILFLEEEGFSKDEYSPVFKKKLRDDITIAVNYNSVFIRILSVPIGEYCCYYFDKIRDNNIAKQLIKGIQPNVKELITGYRSIKFTYLNDIRKYNAKSGIWYSEEFSFNEEEEGFVDDDKIVISFSPKNKLYSDELGFALYNKVPF